MQKEIRNRALRYGFAAVILAILLGTLCYNFGVYLLESPSPAPPPTSPSPLLGTFSSYEELRNFLVANSEIQGTFLFLGPWDVRFIISEPVDTRLSNAVQTYMATEGSVLTVDGSTDSEPQYSTTNIQVAGVDELDIVKTDGQYIYSVSGNNIFILKAYPPEEAELLSKITLNGSYPVGIFVNGDRLAVVGCRYIYPLLGYYASFFIDTRTFVNVYDISNKTNPTSLKNFTMSGSYFNSRMIGDYVYCVISQPCYVIYDTAVLPKIYSGNTIKEINASEIYYSNASDTNYLFTTVAVLNMQNTEEEPTYTPFISGWTSNMYVSLSNIYLTFPKLDENTTIYRMRIENSTIIPEARGEVLGRELNQFSMDEYNNYFRIVTTTQANGDTQNNLYILNMNLSIVGKLENITLAFNERIDSARFIENRCYLSTSVVRKDPFLVIDVENASDPKVLGYLKIPGFTRYLHPYDENHVIGIGIDEDNNVKISLFDVNNVSAPIEIDKYAVNSTWSDTPVLTDHKAFLFDKFNDLLAFPVSTYDSYSMWQGVYVFNITLGTGITLRGNVTHQGDSTYFSSYYSIKRVLYIENVLYTLSDMKLKLNSLEDLLLIKEIELS
jgi:inhibitor of cysteine peptidase